MTIKHITADQVAELMVGVGTKIAYVSFTKRDGSEREMWFHGDIPKEFFKVMRLMMPKRNE